MKLRPFIRPLLGSAIALFAISCASTQRVAGRTAMGFDQVWAAAMASLADVNFSASSTDKSSGLIIADQAVVQGQGTVSRLNIMITRAGSGCEVSVTFVPPPGTIGGYGIAKDYAQALKRRIPDIEVHAE